MDESGSAKTTAVVSDDLKNITEGIEQHLPSWLSQQRWVSKSGNALDSVSVEQAAILKKRSDVMLVSLLVALGDGTRYHVLVGLRGERNVSQELSLLPHSVIGAVEAGGASVVAYDALADPDLACELLDVVSQGKLNARDIHLIDAEQSNTSVVFDNKYIVKFFRRLSAGRNPDVEVTAALTKVQYPHIALVLAVWERDGFDLAVCQPFLPGGHEGWALALDAAREAVSREQSGVTRDFAKESYALGEMTAGLHLAMAECFAPRAFDSKLLVSSLQASVRNLDAELVPGLERLIDRLESCDTSKLGKATRTHGDYHLGQTLRNAKGWHMFDFEGEPARPLEERVRPTSPYKDVTGMLRSFHYAAASALRELPESEQVHARSLADEWEHANRSAFLEGYHAVDGVDTLLPESSTDRETLRDAFEAEKTIYELAYERAYRPDWVAIPQDGLRRLFHAATTERVS